MAKKSAGVLLFRETGGVLEVFLVHPGGPFWARKDDGAWTIPKGECDEGEDAWLAARREFEEETGSKVPPGEPIPLEPVRQAGGKVVHAWAVRGEIDPASLRSGTFTLEWPPKSGRRQEFPEVDRGDWFPIEAATRKILKGQAPFLVELERKLGRS
ncbi:MAG TPA: NUDIX domain-containing protein [Candidatus Polarisedimenticolaceae bacterium]|nr:NUDIX domain-containing protein [Candidatus Polarisedimenticolaceae bacterium]